MTSTCTNCSAHIKNIVMIDGKPYGTTCAEYILGTRLPKGFTGDYTKYANEQKINHEAQVADFNRKKEITRNAWADVLFISKAMSKARRNGNNWEADFVSSVASQAGIEILYMPEKNMKPTMDETYEESNWFQGTGGSSRTYYNREPNGLDSLSGKQISILQRIAQ